jgi:hypothetical protein
MYQASWSWWDLVALGGVAWTLVSFLFAFALGRVLRANQVYETAEAQVADPAIERDARSAARDVEAVPVIVTMVQTSLLDQLLPADLAEEAEGETRSSGTRFRPVAGEASGEELPRVRSLR